jgi:3-oxoadipate enol-lactonase
MTNHVEEHVGINGSQLRVRLEGREDAPAVVLAHSLGTDMRLWDAQVPALASNYRVMRYDARGHGQSDTPTGGVTIDLLAGDLLDLIDYWDIKRAHVVGVSLGALTALAVALRGHAAVKSVTVCNTHVHVSEDFAKAIDERNQLVRKEGLAPLADTLPRRWLSPATAAARPDLLEKLRAMLLKTSPEGFMAGAEAVKTNGLSDRLDGIKLPALFVASDQDAGVPADVMRGMQARVASAEFAEIAGAGHLANVDQPDAFNAALLQFLGRISLP